MNLRSLIVATGFAGMVDGIKNIMETADHLAVSLNVLSAETGISQQKFQQWENVAKQAGVSAGVVDSTIASIQRNLADMNIDPQAAAKISRLAGFFNISNITTTSPDEIFKEVLQSMNRMTQAQRTMLIDTMGWDQALQAVAPHVGEVDKQTTSLWESFKALGQQFAAVVKLFSDLLTLTIDIAATMAPVLNAVADILDVILGFIIQLEQHTPQWVKDLIGALTVLLIMEGVIGAIAKLWATISGLAVVKNFLPAIGTAITNANPWIRGGLIAAGLAGTVYEMLKPKDQSGVNNTTNGGDQNINNTWNINGNNQDLVNQIQRIMADQQNGYQRDAASQNPGINY